ncbi:MAG: DUF1579 domain-containing protein [Planctomycetota bacterium]|nr:DUF1579 domain-containing protein [Planctomycetota bacterium]
MMTPPQKQHEWLRRFVGEWTSEFECVMGPDQPAMKSKGREVVRMVGDLWVVFEGEGEMPGGGTMTSILTLGFDPAKGKFVGSWIGSPMATMFVYQGEFTRGGGNWGGGPASGDVPGSADVQVLPLNTVGPSWADPTKQANYQDVIELHGPNKRLLWSQAQGDDGAWTRFMTGTFTRVK